MLTCKEQHEINGGLFLELGVIPSEFSIENQLRIVLNQKSRAFTHHLNKFAHIAI